MRHEELLTLKTSLKSPIKNLIWSVTPSLDIVFSVTEGKVQVFVLMTIVSNPERSSLIVII